MEEVMAMAKSLAAHDKALNGDYVNSPYKVVHKGETYKAHARRLNGRAVLTVMRPEKQIGMATLDAKPDESFELVDGTAA